MGGRANYIILLLLTLSRARAGCDYACPSFLSFCWNFFDRARREGGRQCVVGVRSE